MRGKGVPKTDQYRDCHLIEDHHQALEIWRKKKIKMATLVHIDAHIDFSYYPVLSLKESLVLPGTLREIKRNLAKSAAFLRFHNDFDSQMNLGNFLYPALREGIVGDLYWVVPGGKKEFPGLKNHLTAVFKEILRGAPDAHGRSACLRFQKNRATLRLLGRKLIITTIDSLPEFKGNTLLDIDTDYLVVDNLRKSRPQTMIAKYRPWITPEEVVQFCRRKIPHPRCLTISYSVNEGFTPMRYRFLADQLAAFFLPGKAKQRLAASMPAAVYFKLFELSGRKAYYEKSISLERAYASKYNNYGALYLQKGDLRRAQEEFARILCVDPLNPFALTGLGVIALAKGQVMRARKDFSASLKGNKEIDAALFGLAAIEFGRGNYDRAEKLARSYLKLKPLDGAGHRLLGDLLKKRIGLRVNKDAVLKKLEG
ncbi:MAG: tetratricopeptide repeat protein [Candidatus Omnitrophica bacterium]|nr:tetratricopeptide repeat protein [Candidatus Omnitrophota bacterium]